MTDLRESLYHLPEQLMSDAFLDIRLRDLHFFERLAALGSLTAAARLALLSDAPSGVLRVSVPVPLGRVLAGPVIARFGRRLPWVRLEIVLQNQRVDLLRDGIDVAIRGGELPDSDTHRSATMSA
jgi:DNA-binding transcriptional LysR family regulator